MRTCENCGYENESRDNFCGGCGKSFETERLQESQTQPRPKDTHIRDFFYLIYCALVLIITGIVVVILTLIFGFWIELISFIITLFILIGCLSQIFVAFIDHIRENREWKRE